MIDCSQVLERLGEPGARVSLELGCGGRKRHPEAIGIDLLDLPGVDIVGDVVEVLEAMPDGCVERVWSYHFLEHVCDVGRIMMSLARVCRPGAIVDVTVPHFSNPYFYSDPTHRQPFGLYTLSYFCRDTLFARKVPHYGITPVFELRDVQLGFKSPRPRYIRYGLKKVVQFIVNRGRWAQELYEEFFCYIVPCYEVRYVLLRQIRDGEERPK